MASQRDADERKVNFSSNMSTRDTRTRTEDNSTSVGIGANKNTSDTTSADDGERGGGEEGERGECEEEEDAANDDERENILEGNEFVIDPEGDFVYRWMGLVAFAVAYNVWIIVLRVAFHHHLSNQANAQYFGVVDLVCDTIFVVDFLVNFRVAFLQHGLLVKDPAKLSANYRQHVRFRFDVVAMVPWGVAYEICRGM
nr:cyclic nucleotide-gated olfactory channel-like [Lytechinus pictus]